MEYRVTLSSLSEGQFALGSLDDCCFVFDLISMFLCVQVSEQKVYLQLFGGAESQKLWTDSVNILTKR